jgi:hypothetical protein
MPHCYNTQPEKPIVEILVWRSQAMRIPKLQIAHLEKGLGEEAGRRREGGKEAEGDYWRRQ